MPARAHDHLPAAARLGVLGWPVAHSRSPAMQNAALAELGLSDWRYQLLPVPPEAFAQTVRALGASGLRGANVTIPHKEAALAVATTATDRARAIGAANTLTFGADGAIHADNTDAPGFLAALPAPPAPGGTALVEESILEALNFRRPRARGGRGGRRGVEPHRRTRRRTDR
ncbi:MAG TPA: hypothetical protein PKD63_12020 [Solirubrobacteraceae bacterium]|nr:hypothetical protein [Solirubrobacteraceae bacterium]